LVIFLAGRVGISLAFIGAAVLFLPLFVFMQKLIQCGMKADTEAVIDSFGKNEQIKKVFWTLFVAMAGLVLAHVIDPVSAQQIVGIIMGIGV
jgi:F0F1-type ATP synthase assembly protein I